MRLIKTLSISSLALVLSLSAVGCAKSISLDEAKQFATENYTSTAVKTATATTILKTNNYETKGSNTVKMYCIGSSFLSSFADEGIDEDNIKFSLDGNSLTCEGSATEGSESVSYKLVLDAEGYLTYVNLKTVSGDAYFDLETTYSY